MSYVYQTPTVFNCHVVLPTELGGGNTRAHPIELVLLELKCIGSWGTGSRRIDAICARHAEEDECVELRFAAPTTDDWHVPSPNFCFYLPIRPESTDQGRKFLFWLGVIYLEWSVCRVFHSVRPTSNGSYHCIDMVSASCGDG